jgi:hypothetical protein
MPILEMTKDFVRRTQWQGELRAVLGEIPAHRINNQAVAYINTFTRHEEERAALLNMYPFPEAPLKAIANCDVEKIVVVADLAGISGAGHYSVPALVRYEGEEDLGALGSYQVEVDITEDILPETPDDTEENTNTAN